MDYRNQGYIDGSQGLMRPSNGDWTAFNHGVSTRQAHAFDDMMRRQREQSQSWSSPTPPASGSGGAAGIVVVYLMVLLWFAAVILAAAVAFYLTLLLRGLFRLAAELRRLRTPRARRFVRRIAHPAIRALERFQDRIWPTARPLFVFPDL